MTGSPKTDLLRHLTCWPFDGTPTRLGVAVSGGGDSMALLDLMLWHARQGGVEVHAATVDHGLRSEAQEEAAMVAAFCATRGVPHDVLKWRWDGQGNLQAHAREARYDALARWAKERGIPHITLGHTQDDVAETFLMRLARASGLEGLAAMERRLERRGISFLRPLLQVSRSDLRDYLVEQQIQWAEDSSNSDENFERVRARRVLQALRPLGIDASTVEQVAQHLRGANSALQHYALIEASEHVTQDRGDLILPTELGSLDRQIPSEVMFRLRRTALQFVSGQTYPPRRDAMIDLEAKMLSGKTRTLHGCLVTKQIGKPSGPTQWRVTREHNAVQDAACASNEIWDGRWALHGPHGPDLMIKALGEAGLKHVPDWRDSGLPRASLLSSPAIWHVISLFPPQLQGFFNDWQASLIESRDDFAAYLFRR